MWIPAKSKPNKAQAKEMVALCLGKSMEMNLKLHTYEIDGTIYQQDPKKGVIGLNAQRCGCKAYTIQWLIKYRALLEHLTNTPIVHAINKHTIAEQIIHDIVANVVNVINYLLASSPFKDLF